MEIPRYRCHKEVHALKISKIERAGDFGFMVHFEEEGFVPLRMTSFWAAKHDPQVGGYVVWYDDGYISYSPAEAFEKGYSRIER